MCSCSLHLLIAPEMKYAVLTAVLKSLGGLSYSVVQGFLPLQSSNGKQLYNEYDCPLMELTRTLFTVLSVNIQAAVNIVHECTSTCMFSEEMTMQSIEREHLESHKLNFTHDWGNDVYCYNVFCV